MGQGGQTDGHVGPILGIPGSRCPWKEGEEVPEEKRDKQSVLGRGIVIMRGQGGGHSRLISSLCSKDPQPRLPWIREEAHTNELEFINPGCDDRKTSDENKGIRNDN